MSDIRSFSGKNFSQKIHKLRSYVATPMQNICLQNNRLPVTQCIAIQLLFTSIE